MTVLLLPTTRTVTLTLSATDALSTITQMRFSNTGTSFSTAEAYATTKTWTLSSGAGTKTVYVQFKDAVGNWSTLPITDTIVLDTTAPTISARTATSITTNSSTITWTTNEPATSRVDYGLTTSYGSTTTLDPALVTSHSVLLTGLAPNTTYNYRVRSIDAAGNERVSANSTFKTAAGADTMAPTVQSINRVGTTPTNAASVSWTVLFSESVTAVDAADFTLVTDGNRDRRDDHDRERQREPVHGDGEHGDGQWDAGPEPGGQRYDPRYQRQSVGRHGVGQWQLHGSELHH